MEELTKKVKTLKKSDISGKITKRMDEFEKAGRQPSKRWFSELCFCILTANSKAKTALEIEKELGVEGFCSYPYEDIKNCIIKNKHRFHNNKANYICLARQHMDIKKKLTSIVKSSKHLKAGQLNAREWLAKNIKGLGFKEASHFMRNVGYKDIAIVDRHIINLLSEHKLIIAPKTITKKTYISIEEKLEILTRKTGLSLAELDLYLWYIKTGEILK
ncbi:MAG: N-glycosylase/DNA lyase [Nanoarchaeota archaeon]